MNTPNSFVVQHEQSDPTVIDRDLNSAVGQDQLEVIVLHRIAGLLVAKNAAEIKQVLSIDRAAHIHRHFRSTPYFYGKGIGLHVPFKHAPAVLNLLQILDHDLRTLFTRSNSNTSRIHSNRNFTVNIDTYLFRHLQGRSDGIRHYVLKNASI